MKISARLKKFSPSALKKSLMDLLTEGRDEEMKDLADEISKRAVELFEEYTSGWDGGRDFKRQEIATAPSPALKARARNRETYPNLSFSASVRKEGPGKWAMTVETNNPLFVWLDQGTKGMRVKGDRPVMIMTVAGHATEQRVPGVKALQAGPWVPIKSAAGIPAREWSEMVAEKLQQEFNLEEFKVQVKLND